MTASTGKSPKGEDVARPRRTERITQPTERITVALIPKAGEDLQRLQERTALSMTDITNRRSRCKSLSMLRYEPAVTSLSGTARPGRRSWSDF